MLSEICKHMPSEHRRILVAGLGNELLQDDGVGVHLVRELALNPIPGVKAVEVGTAVLQFLDELEWADTIVAVDAMKAGSKPGSIYLAQREDLMENRGEVSLHDLSLLAVVRFLPAEVAPKVVILGIEPAVIDYGTELTEPVSRALPAAIEAIRLMVRSWQELELAAG
jgi:hydrogenase maturation protease